MYKNLIRPFLFKLAPERVHHLSFDLIKITSKIPLAGSVLRSAGKYSDPRLEREVFGIKFPNPVGLAAGFDKDAKLLNELGAMGFGFVEIGTLTPKGQPGNPQPRLFRLQQDSSLINRMGFNNEGVEAAVRRLKKRKPGIIVGGNIGKNKDTPNEEAARDYETCFESLYPYVDYFVVNVSSPNTPNLRALQEKEPLKALLMRLKARNEAKNKPRPILLKIAPDLNESQLDDIIEIMEETQLDGLIATNTTISRDGLKTPEADVEAIGAGGLSGKALTKRATWVIRYLHSKSEGAFPIIGVGGIMTAEDAIEKLEAGASLIQLYTGFVYEGPGLIKRINKAIIRQTAD